MYMKKGYKIPTEIRQTILETETKDDVIDITLAMIPLQSQVSSALFIKEIQKDGYVELVPIKGKRREMSIVLKRLTGNGTSPIKFMQFYIFYKIPQWFRNPFIFMIN